MNRNSHGEERTEQWRKPRGLNGWICGIESFVGQLRLLVKFRHVGWRRYDLPKSSVKDSSLQRHNE
ncbi:hypothetical protein T4E_5104 [Trichinella pseudospiralis]|uniref:Uncharacterized protein n=1 Tax=Trichinella pseudospiralis TaxID=6337 RepID=A0A0V0XCR2_TRIPS|nr:hypothetical protein T4E_9102 [Trichinella pseudospiralis]KRX85819.1 hypothetical protein T4E_5104 [Trichinella pseudospiralis]